MPRIRTVKPEYWGHPKTAKLSRDARLLFLGLLNESDDEGRQLGSSRRIAGLVFPHDEDVTPALVDLWLGELEAVDMVRRYEAADGFYLLIVGFTEHQKVSHPTPSHLPPPGLLSGSGDPPPNSGVDLDRLSPDLGSGSDLAAVEERGSGTVLEYQQREQNPEALAQARAVLGGRK